jgi:hypothetical protein
LLKQKPCVLPPPPLLNDVLRKTPKSARACLKRRLQKPRHWPLPDAKRWLASRTDAERQARLIDRIRAEMK